MSDLIPENREEQFLADIADGETTLTPEIREEQWLHDIAAGSTELVPNKRKEYFYKDIVDAHGGGGVTVEPLSVTANGTYTAEEGTAYSPVTVNVPTPHATGTLNIASGSFSATITHNLGTRKVFVILQRVNEDHSLVESTTGSPYAANFFMAATTDDFIDHTQEYAENSSSDPFALIDSTDQAERTCVYGIQTYFRPTASQQSQPFLPISAFDINRYYPVAVDDNNITIPSNYQLTAGRWVYHVWKLD